MISPAARRKYVAGAIVVCCLGVLLFFVFRGLPPEPALPRKNTDKIAEASGLNGSNKATDQVRSGDKDYVEQAKKFHGLSKEARAKIRLAMLEEDLSLSSAAVEFLGLSPEQTAALKFKIDGLVASYRAFEAEHAEVKPGSNDPRKQFVFVPPSGEPVRNAFDDLNSTIDAQLSPEQAAFFHRNADVTLNLQTGYAGRFAQLIIVSPNSSPAKPYNIREMVLHTPPEGDFSALDPDVLYGSGAVANQRSELFKDIPARYQGFIEQSK